MWGWGLSTPWCLCPMHPAKSPTFWVLLVQLVIIQGGKTTINLPREGLHNEQETLLAWR